MARQLTQAIQNQITNKRIRQSFTLNINSVDRTVYCLSYSFSYDIKFGSATASIVLNNAGGIFGENGLYKIHVGDIVEIIEQYQNDATLFRKFYGIVDQRSISKSAVDRTITLTCLDYISILQKQDIEADYEGTKVKVEDEILVPNYLPAPNNSLAQVFDFANNNIAQDPPPIIVIRPKAGIQLVGDTPQYDGFNIKYAEGQILLGTPLNALDNYDLYATYYHYTQGLYIEDVLEDLMTEADGYGNYLFGESSAEDVIANHLTETFNNVEGTTTDYLTPNYQSSTIAIKTTTTSNYNPDASGDASTTLYVTSTEGFPISGSGECNGDLFTWTGKTATTLTGVSGLKAHLTNSIVSYEATYAVGQVWYFKYSNITSTIETANFTNLQSGNAVRYIDYRRGRIILYDALSISTNVAYNADYTFKTLQASGIEINRIKFHPREVQTKFDAINKLRENLAPNYIIRTLGSNKIWANYLYQKVNEDYNLTLTQSINFLEDEDLYTRVVFYGKNNNPTNVMLREGVEFVNTDEEYKSTAVQVQLSYEKEENNYWVYKTAITDAGKIDISVIKPTVYINNIAIDNASHTLAQQPVIIKVTTRTETETRYKLSGNPSVTVRQYFYYQIRFSHTSIENTQPIYLYDAFGIQQLVINPGDSNMDYVSGIYHVPGTSQNSVIESLSTATYTIFYSTSLLDIDYNTIRFKINKQLLPDKNGALVNATFQYWTALTPFSNVGDIIDGKFESQVQTEFFAEPPTGLNYAIIDLGQIYTIQALDILGGFYKPDNLRKFDVDFHFSIHYSLNNVDYYAISSETTNLAMTGGAAISLEEKDLGIGFQARYLKIVLEDVKRIDYGENGVWVVAFTECSVYDDIILKSEAKLIPTAYLTEDVVVSTLDSSGEYQTYIQVNDASAFTQPESGEVATAYIGDDMFTYTAIESGNILTGVQGLSEDHIVGDAVTQELESDTKIYDVNNLLPKLGDRLYKEIKTSDSTSYSQEQLDRLSKAYLLEFYKNHSKATVEVLYSPYLEVGQTIHVTDAYNGIDDNYFIESISTSSSGTASLVIARYPSDGQYT
jgi:hypothetical protein